MTKKRKIEKTQKLQKKSERKDKKRKKFWRKSFFTKSDMCLTRTLFYCTI